MPLAEAAERRDFTINAISYDPLTREFIDPHGGVDDIKAGVLRHISPRFAEDPLRVLRGMQFAGRFNLTPHPDTVEFCRGLSADGLSSERLMEEWKKLILKAKTPSKGIRFLRDTGWDRYFPELAALKGVPQEPSHHPEGDAWVHTCHCLDAFAARRTGDEEKDLRIGLAVLCHDFGKATHTQFVNGHYQSHGHEEAGEAPTVSFMRRMTDQTELVQSVVALVVHHMRPTLLHKEVKRSGNPAIVDASVRRLALRLGREGTSIDELCLVGECDKAGRPPLPARSASVEWMRERAKAVQVLNEKPRPLLMGRDLIGLGLKPGLGFKAILEDAFNRQMNGEISSHEEAMAIALNMVGLEQIPESVKVVTAYRAQDKPTGKPAAPSWSDGHPEVLNMKEATGRWFADSIDEASWYLKNECRDGEIVGVRLPAALAERYRVSNLSLKDGGKATPDNPAAFSRRPEREFFLPANLAMMARPVLPEMKQGVEPPAPEITSMRPPLPTPRGVEVGICH
jgi:tRNA nucleotidyltransferase (CCA-adding enzyme)